MQLLLSCQDHLCHQLPQWNIMRAVHNAVGKLPKLTNSLPMYLCTQVIVHKGTHGIMILCKGSRVMVQARLWHMRAHT